MPVTISNITVSPDIFLAMVGNRPEIVERFGINSDFAVDFGRMNGGYRGFLVFCQAKEDSDTGGKVENLVSSWEKYVNSQTTPEAVNDDQAPLFELFEIDPVYPF